MKKILIITPHYPPSNLAAVHRSRLFAQHLPSFGWEPVILTVDENIMKKPWTGTCINYCRQRSELKK
jgi:hypothetical protein